MMDKTASVCQKANFLNNTCGFLFQDANYYFFNRLTAPLMLPRLGLSWLLYRCAVTYPFKPKELSIV